MCQKKHKERMTKLDTRFSAWSSQFFKCHPLMKKALNCLWFVLIGKYRKTSKTSWKEVEKNVIKENIVLKAKFTMDNLYWPWTVKLDIWKVKGSYKSKNKVAVQHDRLPTQLAFRWMGKSKIVRALKVTDRPPFFKLKYFFFEEK